jgi:hypothetical protein
VCHLKLNNDTLAEIFQISPGNLHKIRSHAQKPKEERGPRPIFDDNHEKLVLDFIFERAEARYYPI